VVERLEPIYA